MKHKCPICRIIKSTVGPKYVGQGKIIDTRFNNPVQTVYTKVVCNDCLELYKEGKIEIS